MIQQVRFRIAVLSVAGALALAGCATSGSEDSENQNDKQEISTDIQDEDVTLTLAYVDDPPTEMLVKSFEEKHSDVSIDTEKTAFGDYITSITRSMSSDDSPDIAQYNPGAMRSLVPAGEVLDLSEYYNAYGWDESFPQASLDQLMSDDEAKEFATGSLYAAPGALSVLGVFYNQDVLADAGVNSPPQSLNDFEQALAAVQDNGDQPLSVGGLEVGGTHLWTAILNSLMDVEEYRDWIYGAPDSTIETDGAIEATQTFSDWVNEGYITSSANATSDSDALANFTSGNSAFLVTGNWNAATIEDEMGDSAGFFIFPHSGESDAPVASGSSVAYSVSSRSEHPDVAAAFLDYLSSSEAAEIQAESGFMPINSEASVDTESLFGEVATEFTPVAESNNIVEFAGFATPEMVDLIPSELQGIISGQMTPEEFLTSLQDSWTSYHA